MESLAEEDAPKLSRTELRKQKLAEYLAAKGKLKPPNPRPYLKDCADLKKPPGGLQRSQASVKGKENSVPSASDVGKVVKLGSALSEKNANTTTSKRELRTLPKAPSTSLLRPVIKPTLSKTVPQHCRTHSSLTTTGKNVSIKETKTKPALQTDAGPSKIFKALKTDEQSMSGQARTSFRVSSFRTQTSSITTGIPTRTVVTGKKSLSDKMTCASESKFSTRQLRNKVSTKPEVKAVTHSTQIRPVGKACNDTSRITKSLNRNSQPEMVRSEMTRRQESHSQSNKPGNNKPGLLNTQRKAPTAAATKPRPALHSAVPKTVNPSIRTSATINKTVKLPPANRTAPAAPVPQSLPQRSRSFSQIRGTVQPKTPKSEFNPGTQGVRTVSLDGKKKINAAQEERIRKLQEWRESRGITYKRPPMPVKPVRRKTTAAVPHIYWPTMEKEDEVHRFVCTVDQSLNDCIKLVEQGCPFEQIRDVLSRVPMAQKFSKYWICKVRLMEREGNLNVLPTFEEAIRVVREPVDELRAVIFEILKKKEAKGSAVSPYMEEREEVDSEEEEKPQFDMHTPKPVGALIRGEKGNSSVIKYKITATPGGKRSQQREKSGRVNGHELRFFTPVRRSLRIEKSAPRYPTALQEHDPCVTSLPDLLAEGDGEGNEMRAAASEDSPLYVYRENEALKDHVAIELVYE